ncbi:hypothetical protein LZC95_06465 [Pendulispora brunnea]|uniref:Uncharacterized protein n=1 Tax=Pendulispora brunnea TaxID=2905690 RepID=A0ABZ2KCR9_9BACT
MMSPISVVVERIVDIIPSVSESNEKALQLGGAPRARASKALRMANVETRRYWLPGESLPMEIALTAARAATADSALDEIGMVFYTTGSAMALPSIRVMPDPASDLRVRLGLPNAGALSSVGGCAAYLALIGTAVDWVRIHQRKCLVVTFEDYRSAGTEGMTRYLFADACVAILLAPSEEPGVGFHAVDNRVDYRVTSPALIGLDKAMNAALTLDYHGSQPGKLLMQGRVVGNFVRAMVHRSILRHCEEHGISRPDVQMFIPHQANSSLMHELHRQCFPSSELVETIAHRGNTAGASVGVSLCEGLSRKPRGRTRVYMSAFGAGPGIVNAYYIANGHEQVVRAEQASPASAFFALDSKQTKYQSHVSANLIIERPDSRHFVILPEELFDRVDHPRRILVENAAQAEFFATVLQDHCGIYLGGTGGELKKWAERTPKPMGVGCPLHERHMLAAARLLERVQADFPGRSDEAGGSHFAPIDPNLVHKVDPSNVMLGDVTRIGALFSFRARTSTPEIRFDHPSSHVQGLLLTEVARQAMLATAHLVGLPLDWRLTLTQIDIHYHHFATPDVPLDIRCLSSYRVPEYHSNIASEGHERKVWSIVEIHQDGICCAIARLTSVTFREGPS